MTAAVPDARFRDQLAEVLAAHEPRYRSGYNIGEPDWFECGPAFTEPRCGWRSDPESDDIGADHRAHVASVIAAEAEARVQAAAYQRAVKELEAAADWMRSNHYIGPSRHLRNRAAALSAREDNP